MLNPGNVQTCITRLSYLDKLMANGFRHVAAPINVIVH